MPHPAPRVFPESWRAWFLPSDLLLPSLRPGKDLAVGETRSRPGSADVTARPPALLLTTAPRHPPHYSFTWNLCAKSQGCHQGQQGTLAGSYLENMPAAGRPANQPGPPPSPGGIRAPQAHQSPGPQSWHTWVLSTLLSLQPQGHRRQPRITQEDTGQAQPGSQPPEVDRQVNVPTQEQALPMA